MKKLLFLLPPLLLFALVFALYAPSIHYSLVDLDDLSYITQNHTVIHGFSPASVRAAFSPSNDTAPMYMPLLWLSYMADVSFFGASADNPAPFHAVNVALHALAAVLLCLLLRRLRAPLLWAFLLSLLWAAHPLRVESVAWVTERKDTLSAVFGLAATLLYLASRTPARPSDRRPDGCATGLRPFLFLSLSAFLYAAGLLVKPSLVPLPLAWLVLDVWPLRRIPSSPLAPGFFPSAIRTTAEKILFLPFAAAAAWLAVAQHHTVSGSLAVPWSKRLAVVAPNFLFYVRKTLLPLGLTPLVPEQWDFPPAIVLFSLTICAAFAFCIWTWRKSIPSLIPGTAWMILFFLPASGLQPLPMATVTDRFFYLPSIGLSMALAALPAFLASRHGKKDTPPRPPAAAGGLFSAVLALLLVPLSVLTHRLLPIWSSTDSLYRHVASIFPNQFYAVAYLAKSAIKSSGDFAAAEKILAPALAEDSEAWSLRFIQADCILHRESPDAALDYMFRGHMPSDIYTTSSCFLRLAHYEFFRGGFDAAVRYTERALACYSSDSTARAPALYLALGAAFESGDTAKALDFAHQTRIYPDATFISIENLLPLAIFQWVDCYREQAAALFLRILDANPGRTELWNNILWGLATADWSPVPPAEVLDRTLVMQADSPIPDHPGILDTLAAAQANAGDFDSALLSIQRAIAQTPESETAFRERLLLRQSLFHARKPYRENAFDRLFTTTFGAPAESL